MRLPILLVVSCTRKMDIPLSPYGVVCVFVKFYAGTFYMPTSYPIVGVGKRGAY